MQQALAVTRKLCNRPCVEHNPDLEAVLARLRSFRKEEKLSYSALALRASLSRAALIGMDDDQWAPTSTTIRAIEALIPAGWRASNSSLDNQSAA